MAILKVRLIFIIILRVSWRPDRARLTCLWVSCSGEVSTKFVFVCPQASMRRSKGCVPKSRSPMPGPVFPGKREWASRFYAKLLLQNSFPGGYIPRMPSKTDILDLYFMDARYKLIDIAAFLDRLDRHEGESDSRHSGFLKAMEAMLNPGDQPRAKAVLESLSDHSTEPVESSTIQFAYGAPQD